MLVYPHLFFLCFLRLEPWLAATMRFICGKVKASLQNTCQLKSGRSESRCEHRCLIFRSSYVLSCNILRCRRLTYRPLGSSSNSYERSLQHRNYVKILRFLSLVCERSRREETFSLRSNLMMGNTMQSLVESVSSSIDQQVPMDALHCVRLALECWPRIDVIIHKLTKSHEPCANISVPSPQVSFVAFILV